jgi:hypothetical protein
MRPLSVRARSLLDRYKTSETLPASSKARGLANLMQAVARGTRPRFDVQETSDVNHGSWLQNLWKSPVTKGIAITLFALPALAVAGLASRASPTPSSLPSGTPGVPSRVPPAPLATTPVIGVPTLVPHAPTSTDAGVSPNRGQKASPANRALRSDTARASVDEATIDGEMRLLGDAQAANLSGDSRRALALLDEYSRRFPAGRLNDVQTVARLVALCNLGQASLARREAARFQARYPHSPFSERVKRICAPQAAR